MRTEGVNSSPHITGWEPKKTQTDTLNETDYLLSLHYQTDQTRNQKIRKTKGQTSEHEDGNGTLVETRSDSLVVPPPVYVTRLDEVGLGRM